MVTLSFSEAIMAGLEQERATVCELNNLRLYKIAQGLLWVGEGKALGEVARLLGVSAKTVWNWLKRLMVQGLGWLVGQHYRGRGRKAKLSSEQKQALYALVVSGPQANGFDCGVWPSAMLVELISQSLQVRRAETLFILHFQWITALEERSWNLPGISPLKP